MKKEVFLAIAIGFALGLVITFGIWTANKSLKNAPAVAKASPTPATQTSVLPTPASQPSAQNLSLSITSPEDEALVNTDTVSLTGKTSPNALVAIMYEDEQQITQADARGEFSATIDLIAGYNNISVTAFDSEGKDTTQSVVVTYTTAKI